MEFPARNEHMLHNKRRKSKGEKPWYFKILTARNTAREENHWSYIICHLSFWILFQIVRGRRSSNDK
jgi:hypothetical protein